MERYDHVDLDVTAASLALHGEALPCGITVENDDSKNQCQRENHDETGNLFHDYDPRYRTG